MTLSEKPKREYARLLWGMVLILSVACSLYGYWSLTTTEKTMVDNTVLRVKSDVDKKIDEVERELDREFHSIEKSISKIANGLSDGSLPLSGLKAVLSETFEQNTYLAIGAHFSDSYDKVTLRKYLKEDRVQTNSDKELYTVFFKSLTADKKAQSEPFPYDYTNEDSSNDVDWYSEKVSSGEWFGPYYGSANGKYLISFRAPIMWNDALKLNKGVVVADYSLQHVRSVIQGIELLDSGYIVILNEEGMIISHPVRDYLNKSIEDIPSLNLDSDKIKNMKSDKFYDVKGLVKSGKSSRDLMLYKRKKNFKNWSILVVLKKSETLVTSTKSTEFGSHYHFESEMNKLKIQFFLILALALFLFFVVLSWNMQQRLWVASISFSVLCLVATVGIWYNNQVYGIGGGDEKVQVSNKTDLEAALNTFLRIPAVSGDLQSVGKDAEKDLIKIKTGFFVQSVKFASSNDVYVTGYAWQKLPNEWRGEKFKHCLEDSSECLGFVLPEAETVDMEVVYSDKNLTRWFFSASLRQEFNYLKYPFDEEKVWIRARPKDFFHQGIILVPDFDSYQDFDGDVILGLEKGIFVEGWSIDNTHYSLKLNEYASNFGEMKNGLNAGSASSKTLRNRPELYFNISIRREFLGVFVAYMIPIIVTAFLLFAVIIIRTGNSKLGEKMGYSASTVLGYSASLFFVLVISHMSIRETLNAKGIIYLECFFFSLYVAIAVVSVNSIIFTHRAFSNKAQGLVLQYLYWPALLLSILAATVTRFS